MNELPHKPHLDQSIYWIVERESIRRNKESGKPAPWTKNERMATTRWCNVRRMDDKVSRWLMERFFRKNMRPKDAVLAASVARFINRTETLERMCPKGFAKFNHKAFSSTLASMRDAGEQIFNGAYIINGANANGRSKAQLIMDNLQDMADRLDPKDLDLSSMQNTHAYLLQFEGMGSFMAGQVVADLRHVLVDDKKFWLDRMVWAPQGPGSTRGLNYVFNTPNARVNEEQFLERLTTYMAAVLRNVHVRRIALDRGLEAHDFQNCLCETSKWARLLSGGRSKNKYRVVETDLFEGHEQ